MSKKPTRPKKEIDDRTRLEVKMALTTPMPYELEALGQLIVKEIKQLPPEAQPPALLAAEGAIAAIGAAADASVEALPNPPLGIPHKLLPPFINRQTRFLIKYINKNMA
jgi:hypothetical protein